MPTNLRQTFGDRYRVVDDGTDDADRAGRIWCQQIPGRHGVIYPHADRGTLAVTVLSDRIAKSLRKLGMKVVQAGEEETTFVFDPKLLDQVALLVGSKKRRRLSPEARERATARLKGLVGVRSGPFSSHSEGGSSV